MTALLITICIINSILLILHEIESAYEKEWEILHLPGGISGFILLHIPLLLLLFYCPIGIILQIKGSIILSSIIGLGSLLPLLVHKVLVFRTNVFNRELSNIIIYSNAALGFFQIILCAYIISSS